MDSRKRETSSSKNRSRASSSASFFLFFGREDFFDLRMASICLSSRILLANEEMLYPRRNWERICATHLAPEEVRLNPARRKLSAFASSGRFSELRHHHHPVSTLSVSWVWGAFFPGRTHHPIHQPKTHRRVPWTVEEDGGDELAVTLMAKEG
jgi:hypothetical protein